MFWHPSGDPRTRFAYLGEHIPQERYVAWEQEAKCLCGCGMTTKPLHGRLNEGTANYFFLGHYPAFCKRVGYVRPNGVERRNNATWREAVAKENLDRLTNSDPVQVVLIDWLHLTKRSVRKAAGEIVCDESWLSGIRSGRLKRLNKKSAIRVLTYIAKDLDGHEGEHARQLLNEGRAYRKRLVNDPRWARTKERRRVA